jgi:hypothetical protein
MEIDIRDLSFSQVTISKPKKQDDSLFGKITHGGEAALKVYLYGVQSIRHKSVGEYSVLYAKVPRNVLRALAEFDEHAKEHVRENAARWFTKSLDENVIDEYYMSSMVTLPAEGTVAKLKLVGGDKLQILEPGRYDLLLRVKGLRFFKQRFVAEWELLAVKRLGDDLVSSFMEDEEDDQSSHDELEGDGESVMPTDDDLASISTHLQEQIEARLAPLQREVTRLLQLRSELEHNTKCVAVLDRIAEDLDK